MALQHARIETASLDARLLLQHVLGVSREALLANDRLGLTPRERAHYQTLIDRRSRRQPVSQLIGEREFWGMAFKVTPAVLDPRPDSETLIDAVLERYGDKDAPLSILDLGTGTGCLLLALLNEFRQARGTGVDISEEALKVAKDNAAAHGMARRATFMRSNWGEKVQDTFDVVISNPPYIETAAIASLAPEVAQYEPRLALDGGADGLDCYRAIFRELPRVLKKDGMAAFEIGLGQRKDIETLAVAQGLRVVGVRSDLAGIPRCVLVQL